jgi:hypothetical protein
MVAGLTASSCGEIGVVVEPSAGASCGIVGVRPLGLTAVVSMVMVGLGATFRISSENKSKLDSELETTKRDEG